MSKWLTIEEALEAARETLDEVEAQWFEDVLCKMLDLMALRLAEHHQVTFFSNAAPGEGGIMVSFREGPNGERAEIFDKFDPEGDWN